MAFYYLAGLAANLLTDSAVVFSGDADDAEFPHENIATGKPWEMMRFAAAGTDDYIHANLGSSKSADFCSIHFHNIDSGITAIELRRGSTGATLVATMTKASPSFFSSFASVSDQHWRIKLVGTNASAIYIGEWVLGAKSTLAKNQRWNWSMGWRMPQRRLLGPSGIVHVHNLSEQRLRTVQLPFGPLSDAQLNEHLDDMLDGCAWGEEPLVIVPDSGRNWVIHGRPDSEVRSILLASGTSGLWQHSIEIVEDVGPLIVK